MENEYECINNMNASFKVLKGIQQVSNTIHCIAENADRNWNCNHLEKKNLSRIFLTVNHVL